MQPAERLLAHFGMARVMVGMISPPMHALSPVSAATSPSIDPFPNCSGCLLLRFAVNKKPMRLVSCPTPG